MARTTEMKLLELMVLKQDISEVIEYLGKKGTFQFQSKLKDKKDSVSSSAGADDTGADSSSIQNEFGSDGIYKELLGIFKSLGFTELDRDINTYSSPTDEQREQATKLIASYEDLERRVSKANDDFKKSEDAYKEAKSFSNLQVSYSELEHLSFLSLKIGKLNPENFDDLTQALDGAAEVIPLGEDKTHVLIASSKKGRFAVESELKNFGFVEMEIPSDFKGVPEDVLAGLAEQTKNAEKVIRSLREEKKNYAETHRQILFDLLGSYSVAVQIEEVKSKLQSTDLVYRVTGWVPATEVEDYMHGLDELTSSRIAVREYNPREVQSVLSGKEQVPVNLSHGKFVKSFERMIFSYGSPVYGTIDPTPFVAIFFTLLFGIMFGDCGQGLVFLLMGILMSKKVVKVGGWNKFAPIFMAIGISSSIMGLLTGEFFSNETLLEPFAMWVTGLWGTPHAPIVKMMPSSDPNSIIVMFTVFGIAVGIGFVINTIGLIINIVNNIILKRYAEALFGKNGLSGAVFFWYVIVMIIRIFAFGHTIATYDWIVIGVTLFFASFAEPFERAMEGKKPLLENGFGTYLIAGIVELIEVISGYLSNTVSFVRVGAFALSHAVLDFLILTLTEMVGGEASVAGIAILIVGNAIIIVLEGMIVAIQVIRLQYYEFFSKFFHETGREFTPFTFTF